MLKRNRIFSVAKEKEKEKVEEKVIEKKPEEKIPVVVPASEDRIAKHIAGTILVSQTHSGKIPIFSQFDVQCSSIKRSIISCKNYRKYY